MKKLIEKAEWFLELGGIKKDIIFLILSGIALIISILNVVSLPFSIAWIAIILCGIPIIMEAIIGVITEFDMKADVLVSLALIAAICIGEYFAAGEVAFIMQIGALLEELTVAKARQGIEKLVHLTPQTARVIRNGVETIIPAKQVKVNDRIRVLSGEMIPVDGIITMGQTSVNQAVMTGESMPVDKSVGDEVSSGTMNQFGVFEMQATKVGEDSSIQRMIRLVQSADAGKAKIVSLADRWATWIVIIALLAAVFTWLISGQVIRAVTILVVFCPCALVLATPTAIMAAIGNVTKHGFLVREGDALERLAKVGKVTFDKTGTLTFGTPEVVAIHSVQNDISEEALYTDVASVEQYSEHPLGKAILKSYQKKEEAKLIPIKEFQMLAGQGVQAVIGMDSIIIGNKKLLENRKITISDEIKQETKKYLSKGCTVVFVAQKERLVGYLILSDTVRKESALMIQQLKQLHVEPVLLTGDNEMVANTIASDLGIQQVYANCLPEDKLNIIDHYQKENQEVCMIGDGINDAPALKKSNVGIAMGGIGSDIAVDAADIVLVNDEINELPHLIALSKRMMLTIKFNLTFSMGLNFLAIVLAITGVLNPIFGALVHNAGSIFVIINSALLLKWRNKK